MDADRTDRGDGRDSKGRWITSGNLNGRPPKVPDLDLSDVYNFSQVAVEIAIGGETQRMTRHEVVLLKMFESALRGRITAQKYLLEKFEQADMSRQYLQLWLEKWSWRLEDDPESVPLEVIHLMRTVSESTQERPRSKIRTRQNGKRNRH